MRIKPKEYQCSFPPVSSGIILKKKPDGFQMTNVGNEEEDTLVYWKEELEVVHVQRAMCTPLILILSETWISNLYI